MIFQRSDSFHVHDSAARKCVNVYVNGNFSAGRSKCSVSMTPGSCLMTAVTPELYVEPDWTMRDFLQACNHRLESGTIASRVFNSDGK